MTKIKNSGRVGNESNTVRELVSQKLSQTLRIDGVTMLAKSGFPKLKNHPVFQLSCLVKCRNHGHIGVKSTSLDNKFHNL